MEATMVILNNLESMQRRYNRLTNLFNEFCTKVLSLQKEDARLNLIELDQADNALLITFLDRKIEATFSFKVDDDGGQKGYINCQLLSQTKDEKNQLIETFSFDGEGKTSIASKDINDPYVINDTVDAIGIVLNWAEISVKK